MQHASITCECTASLTGTEHRRVLLAPRWDVAPSSQVTCTWSGSCWRRIKLHSRVCSVCKRLRLPSCSRLIMLLDGVVHGAVKGSFSSMLAGQQLTRHLLLESDASEDRLVACSWFE